MYTVGDVIWVASTSYPSVKPYQVVEEITHKTLKGTVKSFNVRSPSGNGRFVALDDLEGDIFTDVESLRLELNRRASEAIETMLESGNDLIKKYFNFEESDVVFEGDSPNVPERETPTEDSSESAEEDFVTLPDGTKARLKIKGDML